jgi:hypothetical protein
MTTGQAQPIPLEDDRSPDTKGPRLS